MRIVLIGATGTIREAFAADLIGHEVIRVGRTRGDEQVDLGEPASIRALFERVGRVDAVVSAAGLAAFKPLAELSDADFAFSLGNKLMGQVNVVRYGLDSVTDGGSITLTSGTLGQHPEPGTPAISLVNAGLEGFTRAAALEAPRDIRVNVVSPPWVTETLEAMGRSLEGGLPAAVVAKAYVRSVEGKEIGEVLNPSDGDAGHDRDAAGTLVGSASSWRSSALTRPGVASASRRCGRSAARSARGDPRGRSSPRR